MPILTSCFPTSKHLPSWLAVFFSLKQFFAAPSCVVPLSTFICEVRQFFPSHYIRAFPYNFRLIIFKRKIINDQIPFLIILLPDVLPYHLGPLSFFEMQQLFLHYFHTSFLIIAITDLSQTQRLKITHLLSQSSISWKPGMGLMR